jgi:hypothetical protein
MKLYDILKVKNAVVKFVYVSLSRTLAGLFKWLNAKDTGSLNADDFKCNEQRVC